MANNLGQVAIVSRGAWDSSVTYHPLDVVTQSGGSYLCIQENTNKQPGNITVHDWSDYWVILAIGMRTVSVTVDSNSYSFSFSMSDGTSRGVVAIVPGLTFPPVNNDQLATDAVETGNIKDGAVTAAKLATTGTGAIKPENVGIKAGTSVPTSGTGENQISSGQIYIKYA